MELCGKWERTCAVPGAHGVSTLCFSGFLSRIIPVSLLGVLLGLWFGGQAVQAALTPPGSPGVAFVAHVGGFVAGMLLIGVFKRRGVAWLADGGPRSEEARTRPIDIRFRRSWAAGRPRLAARALGLTQVAGPAAVTAGA